MTHPDRRTVGCTRPITDIPRRLSEARHRSANRIRRLSHSRIRASHSTRPTFHSPRLEGHSTGFAFHSTLSASHSPTFGFHSPAGAFHSFKCASHSEGTTIWRIGRLFVVTEFGFVKPDSSPKLDPQMRHRSQWTGSPRIRRPFPVQRPSCPSRDAVECSRGLCRPRIDPCCRDRKDAPRFPPAGRSPISLR